MNPVPHIPKKDDNEKDENKTPCDVFREITQIRLPSGPTPRRVVCA